MIPRSSIDAYTKGINAISEQARARLADVLSQIDYTQDGWVDLVLDAMQTVCGASTDMTSVLAAEYYDYVRELEIGERMGALADSGREPIATEKAVRGIVQKGVDGDIESMNKSLLDRVDYEVKKAAADTVFINGRRDNVKPKFARVPSGAETCKFCLMLASRGFVYRNSATAGDLTHYHANCDCRVVPGFNGKTKVEGYDIKKLKRDYKKSLEGHELNSHYDLLERNGKITKRLYKTAEYDYEAAGYKQSKRKANKFKASRGDLEFNSFEDVKKYIYEAKDQQDLEHRSSQLVNIYGPGSEQMRSQSMKNAFMHMEKRFGNK